MANLVAVDNKNHLNLKVDPNKAELHGAELHLIPVVISEFTNLALQYPIVLTKNGDTGQFVCAAMLGFEEKENLFWQNGAWQGLYVPLQIRRQPFFVGSSDSQEAEQKNNSDYIVCIDTDSPTICSEKGLALFDERGLDTEYFQHAKSCLAQLLAGEADNKIFIEHLQQMDLIQSMTLEVTFANQHSTKLNGLYTIDQEKLAKISDEQILILHKKGLFPSIYMLITSLGQMHELIARKNSLLSA